VEQTLIWQLAAIWAIAIMTLVWLVRDERKARAGKLNQQARYFAQAPQYRYVPRSAPAINPPRPRTGSLLRNDQAFFDRYLSQRAER
jgi:hypothetical protein